MVTREVALLLCEDNVRAGWGFSAEHTSDCESGAQPGAPPLPCPALSLPTPSSPKAVFFSDGEHRN